MTRIFQLQDGDRIINGEGELKKHITAYYKGLFRRPKETSIFLDSSRTEDIPQVSSEEKSNFSRGVLRGRGKEGCFPDGTQ
jgi:hypothetical protein